MNALYKKLFDGNDQAWETVENHASCLIFFLMGSLAVGAILKAMIHTPQF